MAFLTKQQIEDIVADSMSRADTMSTTQQILDSGAIPQLKGFQVHSGKGSDSIVGGRFSYQQEDGATITIDNPPLQTRQGLALRIMVRTQRISTHDIVRGEIPFKDQVLALNHNTMRRLLSPVLGTSQLDAGLADTAIVIVAENLKQLPFENVLRYYMAKSSTATSLYQHYIAGNRAFCGHQLPAGLIANGRLPYVMDTPSTKSAEHDESISPQELIDRGCCSSEQYCQIRNSSMLAFGIVTEFVRKKGLIAVDTKTEHGINQKGQIVSQDEIWTLDSSRFWLADDYQQQLAQLQAGDIDELAPQSYSKEFARQFAHAKQVYNNEQRVAIAVRYIEAVQCLLGQPFVADKRPRDEQVVRHLQQVVTTLLATCMK